MSPTLHPVGPHFSQQSDDFTDHSSCLTSLVSTLEGSNSEEGAMHRRVDDSSA